MNMPMAYPLPEALLRSRASDQINCPKPELETEKKNLSLGNKDKAWDREKTD
jgi:hypothetical protein